MIHLVTLGIVCRTCDPDNMVWEPIVFREPPRGFKNLGSKKPIERSIIVAISQTANFYRNCCHALCGRCGGTAERSPAGIAVSARASARLGKCGRCSNSRDRRRRFLYRLDNGKDQSFSGLLTRVEIGHIRIGLAGNGCIRSTGSGSSLSQRS